MLAELNYTVSKHNNVRLEVLQKPVERSWEAEDCD